MLENSQVIIKILELIKQITIFIYDNNEKNDEKFDLILKDYIKDGFVEIIDFRGLEGPQIKSMEDCRKNNYKKFDWLIFYDMDELLFLRNYSNITDFLI